MVRGLGVLAVESFRALGISRFRALWVYGLRDFGSRVWGLLG